MQMWKKDVCVSMLCMRVGRGDSPECRSLGISDPRRNQKLLLGCVLVNCKEDNNEIPLELDEIQGQLQLHDYKLNLMAK
jgi:hypothetical protein